MVNSNTADTLKGNQLNGLFEHLGLHGFSQRRDNSRTFREFYYGSSLQELLTTITYCNDSVLKVKATACIYKTFQPFLRFDIVKSAVSHLEKWADSELNDLDTKSALLDITSKWHDHYIRLFTVSQADEYTLEIYTMSYIKRITNDIDKVNFLSNHQILFNNLNEMMSDFNDELYEKLILKDIYATIDPDELASALERLT